MTEQLIALLTFVSVIAIGGAILLVRASRRRGIQARLQQSEGATAAPAGPDRRSLLMRVLGRLGGVASSEGPSAGLRGEMAKAGYHGHNAAVVYLGIKISLLVVGLGLGLVILTSLASPGWPIRLLLALLEAGVLFFSPNLVVMRRRRKRAAEVRANLPDAIDLLEICVSAGMGLDMAWNAVADEVRDVCPILSDEMALTNLEIHLGAPRADAMRHMANRTGAQEISSLVSTLVQSDRFGTSISEALRTYATTMREIRSQKAEEAAEKMPVKLLIPLATLIFPALMIVICGPAGIEWMKTLAGR